ncbi:putative disease resistance RPP13-like protein 3 [Sesamum angolense]|uniref:Disease resistance RPP13-like protein 3 n=1 Tax=Sesamum angolense TaxID=2727404 RepID=A0AAE1T939_9LAMI|nr:putative disease resistance RPP13-like protein 3 [Sesamum angolense]
MQAVIETLDSIKKEVLKVKEDGDMKDQGPESSGAAAPSRFVNSGNDTMVGCEEDLIQLMDELTGHDSTRRILAIVGMGGIGKTTLAKNIYDNSFVMEHFHVRAWVTVSQEYNVREIIRRLLHDITVSIGQNMQESHKNLVAFIDGMSRMSDCQLGEQLYKSLWAGDNSNGSRILVTTRLSNVAEQCGSCNIFPMSFLDADESWELFCRHVFGEEDHCPPELEKIGKKIVKKCKGLPLAIIVVEDSYISVSKLIKLWVAEGFLKPVTSKSLEEVAEEYLKDLIDRNLILRFRAGVDGNLKVDELSVADVLQLVNSRYLAFRINMSLHAAVPSSISQLQHLQTLIVESSTSTPVLLPTEIWEMPQLRHLKFSSVCFPDPPVGQSSRQDSCVLENLQTLSYVINLRCTSEVVRRVPNLKKLRLFCEDASTYGAEWSYYCLNNLVHLQKLESLMLTCVANTNKIFPGELDFPHSLKKLILRSCRFPWEDMAIIGSLPNLEVLILQEDAFDGEKWEPNEEEFPQLKFLFISSSNLEYWHAESTHFPKLKNLVLHGCFKLKEIPSDIGEIPTLESISLCLCSSSVVVSAKEILMEQRSLGNDDFRVSVNEWMSINKRLALCPPFYTAPAGVAVLERAGTLPEAEMQNLLEDPPIPWDVSTHKFFVI